MVLLLVTFCIELNSALNRNDDTPIEWDTRAGEKDFRWVLTWKERRSGRGSGGRCGMVQFPNDLPGQQKRTDRRRRTGSTKPASMQQQHQQDSSENRYRRYFVCFPWIFKQFYFIVFQIYTAEDDRRTRFLFGTLLRLRMFCAATSSRPFLLLLFNRLCLVRRNGFLVPFFVCRIRLTDVKCQRGRQERKPRLAALMHVHENFKMATIFSGELCRRRMRSETCSRVGNADAACRGGYLACWSNGNNFAQTRRANSREFWDAMRSGEN